MKLNQIRFKPVWGASGVQGFFGEGYWYHKLWKYFGLNFSDMTFVSKTTTLHKRKGNMPLLTDGITPQELMPKCVCVRPFHGVALNAVGLSGPGFQELIDAERWQKRRSPFCLSFMAVGATQAERFSETNTFCVKLERRLYEFSAPLALQINWSCPNVGHDITELLSEIAVNLQSCSNILGEGIPLIPKLNALVPVADAWKIANMPECAALCVSNTIPYGALPEEINWEQLFGSATVSPLEKRVGKGNKGGLSGAPLLPLVRRWVRQARNVGITKPIIAGGGILSAKDVRLLAQDGASAVSIGTMAMLRPWRVKEAIRTAYQVFS